MKSFYTIILLLTIWPVLMLSCTLGKKPDDKAIAALIESKTDPLAKVSNTLADTIGFNLEKREDGIFTTKTTELGRWMRLRVSTFLTLILRHPGKLSM